MREHILITGGAGYIGSHTCKALARKGFIPVTLDDMSYGHAWAVKWGPLVAGDIADGDLVRQTVLKFKIKKVLHFAASTFVGESVSDPKKYVRNNIVNASLFLENLIQSGINQLIFSSTCAIYGTPEVIPISESESKKPINPYGFTKMTIESILSYYFVAYGLSSVSLRYFNAAGDDIDSEIGEAHEPETHLIPLAIRATQDPTFTLKIFGKDYPTPDGTCIRDYIHVSDLADAHILSLDYLNSKKGCHAFNVGIGKGFSVLEIIAAINKVSNHPVKHEFVERRPGDPSILVADSSKIQRELNWSPKYGLDEIISSAMQWHNKQREH